MTQYDIVSSYTYLFLAVASTWRRPPSFHVFREIGNTLFSRPPRNPGYYYARDDDRTLVLNSAPAFPERPIDVTQYSPMYTLVNILHVYIRYLYRRFCHNLYGVDVLHRKS